MADAWHAARDLVADGRARCLREIADALGVPVERLPPGVQRALVTLAHESFVSGVRYAHEAPTIPPRPIAPERGGDADPGVTRVGWPRRPRG